MDVPGLVYQTHFDGLFIQNAKINSPQSPINPGLLPFCMY